MGMATILQARRIVLLATGRGKARAVRRMIEGRVTPRVPASFLQLHGDVEVWLDRAAASRLTGNLAAGTERPGATTVGPVLSGPADWTGRAGRAR